MLEVSVASFSYKSESPFDMRVMSPEHGGGYVFDCRCVPNPGREERFKSCSGLDAGVIEYLENIPDAEHFYVGVRALVDQSVEQYLARGFSSLSVAFGCTGGQHRSVYFAERLAVRLRSDPRIAVSISHEQRSYWKGCAQ